MNGNAGNPPNNSYEITIVSGGSSDSDSDSDFDSDEDEDNDNIELSIVGRQQQSFELKKGWQGALIGAFMVVLVGHIFNVKNGEEVLELLRKWFFGS